LNLKGGKTTALVGLTLADQWEGRKTGNLDKAASLARNIAPKGDATPRGDATPTDIYPAENLK
jgi:hypothetical protein